MDSFEIGSQALSSKLGIEQKGGQPIKVISQASTHWTIKACWQTILSGGCLFKLNYLK